MENENIFKLKPNFSYWEEVFSSFILLRIFNDYFQQMKSEPDNNEYPISKLFYDLFNKKIEKSNCPIEFQKIIFSKKMEKIINNPPKLFGFLLVELHNEIKILDGQKNINNYFQKVAKEEKYLNEKEKEAYKFFKLQSQNENSFVQNLFFGIKKIIKSCKNCKTKDYIFRYFIFCPFNIEKIKEMVDIKDLYENIQREFDSKNKCQDCQNNFTMKIEIFEEPKILILLFFNYQKKTRVDFDVKFNDKYIIESFIMGKYERKSIFECLCSKTFSDNNKSFVAYRRENKNTSNLNDTDDNNISNNEKYKNKKNKEDNNEYFKIENGKNIPINKKELNKGNPYIIFYSKISENNRNNEEKIDINETEENYNGGFDSYEPFKKIKDLNYYSMNGIENEDKNSNKIDGKNLTKSSFDHQSNKSNDKNTKQSIIKSMTFINNEENNNNLNINEIQNEQNESVKKSRINKNLLVSNNTTIEDDEGLIRLYFMFTDGNILCIDVDNSATFQEIVQELKKQNEWISINADNLYFNDIKIDGNQRPESVGMKHGDYIEVYSNLVDQ